MIRANAHRFEAIHTLVLVEFFPIGLLTSTAVVLAAGGSGLSCVLARADLYTP
jgi:hypothetical protein